jgi:hypothetical protein
MKKLAVAVVLLFVVVVAALYFGINFLLKSASGYALDYLSAKARDRGIAVQYTSIGNVGLEGLNTVAARNVVALVNAPKEMSYLGERDITLSVGTIRLDLPELANGIAAIKADDISVKIEPSTGKAASPTEEFEGLSQGKFGARIPFQGNISPALLTDLAGKMLLFLQEGEISFPVEGSARSAFKINGTPLEARIWTKEENGAYALVMSPEDITKISDLLQEGLTAGETELLSSHPLRAPDLLRIRNYARRQSEDAYAKDRTVPEDAYRHVLWSFLLTKQYGPEFAEKVTDAHEIGSINRNTEADHQMDFQNNKVGREYARTGNAEDRIFELVMTDSQVVRYPKE